jgi:hypothetical protein
MSCEAFPFREDSWGIIDPNTANLLVFVMDVERNVTFSYCCHAMCLSSKRHIWISALYDSNTLKTPIGWVYRLHVMCGVCCMLCVMCGDMMLLIEILKDWMSTSLLFTISLLSIILHWLKFKKSFWEAVLWQGCSLG